MSIIFEDDECGSRSGNPYEYVFIQTDGKIVTMDGDFCCDDLLLIVNKMQEMQKKYKNE